MAFIKKDEIEISAVLTSEGREILATNDNNIGLLDISCFKISDCGIDYKLYNIYFVSGTSEYGIVYEDMPILQPNKKFLTNEFYYPITCSMD